MILGQVKANDPLISRLKNPKAPSILWFKDVGKEEYEVFEGTNDKMSILLWIQHKGSRRYKLPDKKLTEVDRDTFKTNCGAKDKSYCLIAFYENAGQKAAFKASLATLVEKYQEDPLKIYLADAKRLSRKCLFGSEQAGDAVYFLRTKRRKFESFGVETKADKLAARIDSKLSGSMIRGKMKNFPLSCYY